MVVLRYSKIVQGRPARLATACLSGKAPGGVQDPRCLKPNQPKVFYDIRMTAARKRLAAPSAEASASRAAARLMDDDSGTLTAKMLKPHHIS